MSQINENINDSVWDLFEETTVCDGCWGCGWVIEELNIPFYDVNFDKLLPGDKIIRCQQCNKAPQFESKPKSRIKYEDGLC